MGEGKREVEREKERGRGGEVERGREKEGERDREGEGEGEVEREGGGERERVSSGSQGSVAARVAAETESLLDETDFWEYRVSIASISTVNSVWRCLV